MSKPTIFSNFKTVREKVVYLLQNDGLKDSDERLIANFWAQEVGSGSDKMTAEQFLRLYSKGVLTSAESIRRTRQIIQKQMPELRGKNYEERKKLSVQTAIDANKATFGLPGAQ